MYKYKCAKAKKAASTDPSGLTDLNRDCGAVMSVSVQRTLDWVGYVSHLV